MSRFFMLGKYSSEAVKGLSSKRTNEAVSSIEEIGGKVISMYALMGGYDLVLIVDFPGLGEAMKASIVLSKLTGISFSTFPAVTVEQFDEMIAEL